MTLTLDVRHLRVSTGEREVLKDVSLTLPGGELACVLGRNACGKTTLLKCIAGLLPHEGSVRLVEDGRELRRSALSYLPQLANVTSRLTVFEMVMLGLGGRLSWRVPAEVLDQVDATLHAMHISDLAERPVHALSGGQKQLVFMAQSFVSRPRALLLDEPTSALDLRHQLVVMEAARSYARETGAVVVAVVHDLQLAARFASRLVLVADGRIRLAGTPGEVLVPDEIREAYGVEATVERLSTGRLAVSPERPVPLPEDGHGHAHAHVHPHQDRSHE